MSWTTKAGRAVKRAWRRAAAKDKQRDEAKRRKMARTAARGGKANRL